MQRIRRKMKTVSRVILHHLRCLLAVEHHPFLYLLDLSLIFILLMSSARDISEAKLPVPLTGNTGPVVTADHRS